MDLLNQVKEAVGFLGDQEGHIFYLFFPFKDKRGLHLDGGSHLGQGPLELGEGEGEVLDIHHHVHDQGVFEDALVDVFDIDIIFVEEGGDGGNDALVVGTGDADTGYFFVGDVHFPNSLAQIVP